MNPREVWIPAFLRLPRELRDMIYDQVFESSRLRYGIVYEDLEWIDRNARRHQPNRPQNQAEDWVLTEKSYRHIRPAPNTLALTSTCRQIYAETCRVWLPRILFVFNSVEDMLDKLSPLPEHIISQIRHVQVSPAHSGIKRYPLASVLKVLPQLNLDTLTVVMSYASRARQSCPDNGCVIDDLVRYGTGWRKLYFVTADSLMLTSVRFDVNGQDIRPAQPASWADALAARDWPNSDPVPGTDVNKEETERRRCRARAEASMRCRVYRATDRAAGSVLDPRRRRTFVPQRAVDTPAWLAIEDRVERKLARAVAVEEARAAERGERAREMLVVVERRRGVDVTERGERPYCVGTDFRACMGGKPWREYWRVNHHVTARRKEGDLMDAYDSPYEFRWVASERKGVTWPVSV